MKKLGMFLVMLTLTGFIAGCEKPKEPPAAPAAPAAGDKDKPPAEKAADKAPEEKK